MTGALRLEVADRHRRPVPTSLPRSATRASRSTRYARSCAWRVAGRCPDGRGGTSPPRRAPPASPGPGPRPRLGCTAVPAAGPRRLAGGARSHGRSRDSRCRARAGRRLDNGLVEVPGGHEARSPSADGWNGLVVWPGSSMAATAATATTTARRDGISSWSPRPGSRWSSTWAPGPLLGRAHGDQALRPSDPVLNGSPVPNDGACRSRHARGATGGEPFVRLDLEWENRSRDHRLRLHVPLARAPEHAMRRDSSPWSSGA